MNSQYSRLPFFLRILCTCGICLLMATGSFTAIAAPNSDSCALLKPADLAMLLGGKVVATKNAGACSWTASGSKKKLIAAQVKQVAGVPVEMAFMGTRQGAASGGKGKVTDETGLGDKAFSVKRPSLVALYVLKHGRMIELQYITGTSVTAMEMGEFRSVAKKAIAAF